MPNSAKPFKWGTLAATDKAGMTLSMFPLEDTSTGLDTNAKKVEIEIKGLPWDDYSGFTPPSTSVSVVELQEQLSASLLAAGFVASLGIAISLL